MTMLYKYTTCDLGLKIIDNQSFYWSNVSSFNDPFECLYLTENNIQTHARTIAVCLSIGFPILQTQDIGDLIEKHNNNPKIKSLSTLREVINECHTKYMKNKTSKCYFDIEKKIYNTLIENKEMMPDFEKVFLDNSYSNASKKIFNKHGILCLSESKNNILMWSHYAKNHSGVMFELNKNKLELDQSISMEKIKYQDNIPICNYDELLGINPSLSENKGLFEKSILIKSGSWSYEDEVRLLRKISNDDRLHPFPKESFNAIYLGCKIESEKKKEIIRKVKETLPKTLLFQTKISNSDYKLDSYQI